MSGNLLHIPQMLLIGSTGRNSGKTTLAAAGIHKWKERFSIVGLKVTTIRECDGKCPRGGDGCGACTSLCGHFDLSEETIVSTDKDTSIMLASGCQNVYWLRTLSTHIEEGIAYFLDLTPSNVLIICESNSLRQVVKPGVFVMLKNTTGSAVKETAYSVIHKADIVIEGNTLDRIDSVLENIKVDKSEAGMLAVSCNFI